jgi:hypothetical protein
MSETGGTGGRGSFEPQAAQGAEARNFTGGVRLSVAPCRSIRRRRGIGTLQTQISVSVPAVKGLGVEPNCGCAYSAGNDRPTAVADKRSRRREVAPSLKLVVAPRSRRYRGVASSAIGTENRLPCDDDHIPFPATHLLWRSCLSKGGCDMVADWIVIYAVLFILAAVVAGRVPSAA